jgi:hypothetical protein
VPTFAIRGCRVVSVADNTQILGGIDLTTWYNYQRCSFRHIYPDDGDKEICQSLVLSLTLTRLIALEGINAFIRYESLKSSIYAFL